MSLKVTCRTIKNDSKELTLYLGQRKYDLRYISDNQTISLKSGIDDEGYANYLFDKFATDLNIKSKDVKDIITDRLNQVEFEEDLSNIESYHRKIVNKEHLTRSESSRYIDLMKKYNMTPRKHSYVDPFGGWSSEEYRLKNLQLHTFNNR